MAGFNGFPATYQPMYYPQYQMPAQQTQQANSGIIWVQGEAGAKSYLVQPNTTVQLWDSENQTIYLKSADASGMPSMKYLDYTIRDASQAAANAPVTVANSSGTTADKAAQDALRAEIAAYRNDIEAIRAEMDSFRNDLYGIAGKKPTARKKEVTPDE